MVCLTNLDMGCSGDLKARSVFWRTSSRHHPRILAENEAGLHLVCECDRFPCKACGSSLDGKLTTATLPAVKGEGQNAQGKTNKTCLSRLRLGIVVLRPWIFATFKFEDYVIAKRWVLNAQNKEEMQ